MPAAEALVSAYLEYRFKQLVPELAARLAVTPLVVSKLSGRRCSIAIYDALEGPRIWKDVEVSGAESL